MRAERQLLMNVRETGITRVSGITRRVCLARKRHRSQIGGGSTAQNIQERAFASAVLADECMNFSGINGKINAGERGGGAKILRDAVKLKQRHIYFRYLSSGG